jgi:hypothetical protein
MKSTTVFLFESQYAPPFGLSSGRKQEQDVRHVESRNADPAFSNRVAAISCCNDPGTLDGVQYTGLSDSRWLLAG